MFATRMLVLVSFALDGPTPPEAGLTADQFLRLVQAQQAAIQDVAFAFEGEQTGLGPTEEAARHFSLRYQGRYALRSDGATYLEHFRDRGDGDPADHVIRTILHGHGETAPIWPGWDVKDLHIMKGGGGPGAFFSSDSPETFQFLWRYQSLKGVGDFGYKFLGWEDVDGHRCAHVEFDAHPSIAQRTTLELWVDLERGGHPLRIKNSDGHDTVYVIDEVRLARHALPSGEQVWFPTGGRYTKYHGGGEYHDKPMGVANTYVLNGTLHFNQGLGDGVFHVKSEEGFRPAFTPRPAPPVQPATAPRPAPGADFEEAEAALDRALADPSRVASESDASRATRSEAFAASRAGWFFGLGGTAVLIGAILARRMRGTA